MRKETHEGGSEAGEQENLEKQFPDEGTSGPRSVSWDWLKASVVATVVFAATVLAVAMFNRRSGRSKQAMPDVTVKSIAILPFEPPNAEQSDEALGMRITDALIIRLGSLKQVIVRPTSAVGKYAQVGRDPLAAGREQQVALVLDGSLQHAGERIRVTARLLNVADGKQLWAGEFDERYTDVCLTGRHRRKRGGVLSFEPNE